jgi:uncharacterized membrane protein
MLPLESPLVSTPPALFAFLAAIVATVHWLGRRPSLSVFFRYCPPLIWSYFIPMICSSLGIIPSASTLYGFMMRVILPVIVVLLLVGSDTAAIARVGRKGIAMMLIGTLGIVAGAVGSFALFLYLLPPGTLPADMWKGMATLSGSWIGGSPNMAAIAGSLGLEKSALFGKLVVVDTVCAYTWLGILIAGVAWQERFDRFNRTDSRLAAELSERLSRRHAERSRPITMSDFITMLAVSFVVGQLCLLAGDFVASQITGAEAAGGLMKRLYLSQVMSGFGWGLLLVTFVGIGLSFTRFRELEDAGASVVGNAGLYLLLTTFGAQADLRAIQAEDGWLFAIGATWLLIHITVLLVGARLLRAPLFLVATGSMANIGGTASAPVVAAAFHPSLAPVGLLMAILGGILGTPVGLLIVGKLCALIAGE